MCRRGLLCSVLLVGLVPWLAASPAQAAEADRKSLVQRIVAKADPKLMEVLVTTRGPGGRPDFDTIAVPDVAKAKQVVSGLLGKPGVESVEMNSHFRAVGDFDEPHYWNGESSKSDIWWGLQWGLNRAHLNYDRVAYVTRKDKARPYVAVVDSGAEGDHDDLYAHMKRGYNAFSGTTLTPGGNSDDCGHGTHVAAIIAAGANNEEGIVGLAQRAWIRPVKVLANDGEGCGGDADVVADGIVWAAENAHIINLSLASYEHSAAVHYAVEYALALGRVVVAAVGNDNTAQPAYPAAESGVIGVGAVDWHWDRAWFSNTGAALDVMAPGVKIVSAWNDGVWRYEDGTSMAAPHVTALAVLARQHCNWWGSKISYKIQTTASTYPKKYSTYGYGVINPLKLLTCK